MSKEPQYLPTLKRASPLRVDKYTLSAEVLKTRGVPGLQRHLSVDGNVDSRGLSTEVDYRIHPSIAQLGIALSCETAVDVHLSAALFYQDLSVTESVGSENHQSSCGAVIHSGDKTVSEGQRENEAISVNTLNMPLPIHYVLLTASVRDKDHCLEEVKNAVVQLTDKKRALDGKLWTFPLKDMSGNALLVALMTRKGVYWHFQLLGTSVTGHSLETILQNPSNLNCLRQNPSTAPLFRHVRVHVLQGMDLAAKDRSPILRRPSSDPYFIISFKERDYKSPHKRKTLEPHWNDEPFDLGTLAENETEGLKIEVFDHDSLKHDDFMGSVWIRGSEVYGYGPGKQTLWFFLGPSQKEEYRDKTVSGQIQLQFDIEDL